MSSNIKSTPQEQNGRDDISEKSMSLPIRYDSIYRYRNDIQTFSIYRSITNLLMMGPRPDLQSYDLS